eukprot:scaffold442_cov268-Pinguiococcus_pyrenoidosus.AAC.71
MSAASKRCGLSSRSASGGDPQMAASLGLAFAPASGMAAGGPIAPGTPPTARGSSLLMTSWRNSARMPAKMA